MEMVLLPAQRKERETRPILRYTQESAQSSLTLWANQNETLFETPQFARKDLEHLFGLAERNPVVSTLDDEDGKENIFEGWNLQVFAHQLKGSHEGIRVRMDLGRRQLSRTKYLPHEIRERESKTHVFENHLIHGKDMVFILRTHPIRCARE